MKKFILTAASALMFVLSANADTIRFAYSPSLSPDGTQIYFSYDGDIFTVPAEGGLAKSLISLGGVENNPIVSPDGRWLAFSSDIQGNLDVYVVPVIGGKAVQLTYHQASDVPVSWSADSKFIYFESVRGSARRTSFKVAVAGGTPELLFDGFFNTIVNVVENPKTGEILFNESMESISFPTRKRYVGDHNPEIKSWNPKSKEYKVLSSYEGKDTWPMVDKSGNLYYVTDEYNKESNIVKYVKGEKPEWLTTFDKSVQYPKIAANGSSIVFLKDYQINILDLNSGKCSVPSIRIASNTIEVRRSFSDQKPSSAAVSPDGKKFALVIRGGLYVSDIKCEYLHKLNTPENERVDDVVWSKDNKTIFYTRTNKGWTDLYRIAGDASSEETLVYKSPSNIQSLTLSHKKDKLAFIDGSKSVMLCDLDNYSVQKLADAEFWSFQSYDLSFSADDNYLAFDAMSRFENDIFLYSFADSKLVNLTNSASSEGGMVFSPDGRNMYFVANLEQSSFPRGGSATLYKLPLQKYDTAFKSDKFDKLFVEEEKSDDSRKDKKKDSDAQKDSSLKIDYTDIFRRMAAMERRGNQYGLYVFSNRGKDYLLYTSYGGANGCFSLEISDPEAKPKQIKDLQSASFISSDDALFAIGGGALYKVDPASASASKIEVSKAVEKDIRDEFEEMFYETWAVLEQNYYDVNFHGADWYAVRDYYASLLPDVRTRDNLRTILTDMLGELNSSHLGFSSTGGEESTATRVSSYLTGIVFNNKAPYAVEKIVPYSPADKYEIDIRKGDKLVSVNGQRVDESINREKYFSSTVPMDEVKLTFLRAGKEFDTKVHTTNYSTIKSLQYIEWEEERKAMVEKKTDGRVAYIHMQAMGDSDLQRFLRDMHTYAVNKDALILDLRYNNGGNVHKEVIDFLRQDEHFSWSYRDFPTTTHPNVVPATKPIVCLVNEHSLSDAEVTSNGIKTLGIAKLVGTETYRWIIFTSSVRLIDGSTCRMPAWGCYNLEGEDMESVGVKPDIYVKNTFKDRLEGKDPQLDAAIKEVLSQLKRFN